MKFLSLCIFILGCFAAGEIHGNQHYVSLGGCCEVAAQLRNHQLRTEAYPFDWMLTLNHEKFVELLDNDFQYFLEEKYIFKNPDYPSMLENHYYECEFRHDPPTNPADELTSHLQEITPKYERRIARFRNLREREGKVIFIRSAYDLQNGGPYYWWNHDHDRITAEQAQALKTALDRYFPKLDFTLVILNYIEESIESIDDIQGVIEFKVCRSTRNQDYTDLLRSLQN